MNDGKWIRDLKPDMPLTEAARHVLATRLGALAEQMPLAKQGAERAAEHVHQLRVAARRSDAALRIFRDCLSRKVYRAARQRLRTIRRAAGAARDCDVFLMGLQERMTQVGPDELAGLDFLVGYSLGQRHTAQQALDGMEEGERMPFEMFVTDLLAQIALPAREDRRGLAERARTLVPALLHRLEQAAAEDLGDYDRLHQVRIAGKRLRYAMEVVVNCFAEAFREEIYPQVEEMQEVLGQANDSHVASQRLWRLREELRNFPETFGRAAPGIGSLLRFHQERLAQQRRRFLAWWERWRARAVAEALPGLAIVRAGP